MFHWRGNWFFRRLEDGSVKVRHLAPLINAAASAPGFGQGDADIDLTIPGDEWVSIVHAMLEGGTAREYAVLKALHAPFPEGGGVQSVLSFSASAGGPLPGGGYQPQAGPQGSPPQGGSGVLPAPK